MAFDLTDKIKFIRERATMEQKMEERQEAKLVEEVEKQNEAVEEMPVEAPQKPVEAPKSKKMGSCACDTQTALIEALIPKLDKIDLIYDGLVELGVIREPKMPKGAKKKGKK